MKITIVTDEKTGVVNIQFNPARREVVSISEHDKASRNKRESTPVSRRRGWLDEDFQSERGECQLCKSSFHDRNQQHDHHHNDSSPSLWKSRLPGQKNRADDE